MSVRALWASVWVKHSLWSLNPGLLCLLLGTPGNGNEFGSGYSTSIVYYVPGPVLGTLHASLHSSDSRVRQRLALSGGRDSPKVIQSVMALGYTSNLAAAIVCASNCYL